MNHKFDLNNFISNVDIAIQMKKNSTYVGHHYSYSKSLWIYINVNTFKQHLCGFVKFYLNYHINVSSTLRNNTHLRFVALLWALPTLHDNSTYDFPWEIFREFVSFD